MLKQQADKFKIALIRSLNQRRPLSLSMLVGVGAMFQQHLGDVTPFGMDREHQYSQSLLAFFLRVWVCPSV